MYSKIRNNSMCFVSVSIVLVLFFSMGFADYDADGVDLVGRNPYGYCPFAVASGDFVYSANGTVLEVLDIHTLEPVSEVVTESIVSGLAVSGDFVYIANWSDGFRVVDVSDPTNPSMVAELEFLGQCWDISVTGDFAYVGNDDQGLRIIDISNPLIPTLASTFLSTPGVKFEHAQVIDTLAYAATQSGLFILDVSDPAAPVQLGHSPAENGAWSVHVVDTIAYLPKVFEGIRMVNVADPTNPIELGYFQTPDAAYWMEVVDTIAYVAERFSGIQILDISDLTAPDSVGMLSMDYADALYILGDSMYVASSSWGLKQVDISDLTAPVLVNECKGGGYPVDIQAADTITYVAMRGLGVGIFTYDEFFEPDMIALIEMDNPYRLHVEGELLFVLENYNLHIYDVSDPSNPVHTYSTDSGGINSVFCMANLLYVGGYPDLRIFDISDPYFPAQLGEMDGLPSSPYSMYVSGGFAFLTNRWGGLHIVNVMDPIEPWPVGAAPNFEDARAVYVAGEYAYVTDRYVGELKIIDIGNPEDPYEISSFSVGNAAVDVYGSGRYAYVIDSWTGVRIIDCGDPYNPVEVGYFNTGGYAQAVIANQGQLHVADGGGGFYLLETEFKQAVFTVNSTGDAVDAIPGDGICDDGTGDCTLRAAINEANATPGFNTINFDIEGVGPHTFQPASALPTIIDPVEIDGSSEPDFLGTPIVELDGSLIEVDNGLNFATNNCLISNLVISGFDGASENFEASGIYILNGRNIIIEGCYIGTNNLGSSANGNVIGVVLTGSYNQIRSNLISGNTRLGLEVSNFEEEAASFNHITNNKFGTDISGMSVLPNEGNGCVLLGARFSSIIGNTFSGNTGYGLQLTDGSAFNEIQGNFLGCDPTGTIRVPNENSGVNIRNDAHDNLIGGTEPGAGNVISGNNRTGLSIGQGTGASLNYILGNRIGTNAAGTDSLVNTANGIVLFPGAFETMIGGLEPGEGNLISGNRLSGISIRAGCEQNSILGNYIGTDISGSMAIPNQADGISSLGASHDIRGNLISGNNLDGILIEGESASGNQVFSNRIGSDASGTAAIPNALNGIHILEASSNQIGGINDDDGNLISGNEYYGIHVEGAMSTENIMQGNLIGTDISGMEPLGNSVNGIGLRGGANNNLIGGAEETAGNVISANGGKGITLIGEGTNNNIIQDNFIGCDITGDNSDLGNGGGIVIAGGASNNLIGGMGEFTANWIGYNLGYGITIRDTSNTAGNSILGNGFTQNEIAGIDLSEINRGNDGPTANDSADVDTGPNNLQNYPERLNCGIESNNDFMLQFFIDSDPAHSAYPIHVEFFQADEESNQGYYLVVTDEYSDDDHTAGLKTLNLGNANELGQEGLWNGIRIVATATDANGNTSEFSEAIEIGNYVGIAAVEALPEVFTLEQNYPNPFNPTTTIRYGLPEASDVRLVIYDLKGRIVQSYSERGRTAGWVNYEWSGTNMSGEPVSTGVYLCRLVAGEYSKTIKMVYLR
ncbi:MAG: T9SS type A sorting domain-containing protein [Candidatus Marinimicrobia bacterium]|nr:T9SS type A sorting domain-containing protein [FCB group bacterium]MBL7024185.1 T9SS type A sorting domain-containing protein [Candidatus Neomarinimicrobiota bacterium]